MNSLWKVAIGAAVGYAAYRIVQNYIEIDASICAAAEKGDETEDEDSATAASVAANDDPEPATSTT
ncbi:MAG: hypothetical protein WCI51_07455 [Lentisphaerota bacterium]